MANKLYIKRYLEDIAFSNLFSRQMRFVAGPRQVGKTTIALHQLKKLRCKALYYNWDKKQIRDRYRKETDFLAKDILNQTTKRTLWVCFDEIHKMPKWKNILKDYFDTYEKKIRFVITGSAKLDMFRKSGDSLAGRYFLFKLNPLILSEFLGKKLTNILPEREALQYIEKSIAGKKYPQKEMEAMLKFSGFPEPLLKENSIFSKKWHDNYFERIIKEDLRDLSSIHQLEKVMDLLFILPSKVGAPLSINSIREDIELNFNTVKNYINYLTLTCILFPVFPYQKRISRLIKKEKKFYFYNFSLIPDEAKRFENWVAIELKARIDLWNDILEEKFEVFFIRTRDRKETDFLITRNSRPFFLCEAKLSQAKIEKHHYLHAKHLGNIPFIQLVKEPHILKVEQQRYFIVSASRFFS